MRNTRGRQRAARNVRHGMRERDDGSSSVATSGSFAPSADPQAFIEPSPPPDDATLPSHHEYPDYSEEFTPYPFFPTPGAGNKLNGPGPESELAGDAQAFPPAQPNAAFHQPQQRAGSQYPQGSHPYPQYPPVPQESEHVQGFPQPHPYPQPQHYQGQFTQQNGSAQDFVPAQLENVASKTTLSRSVSGIAIDFIPELSEPDSDTNPRRRRGYELGTRPPPVPPKSPRGQAAPKPPSSHATDNSAALIERHRDTYQRGAAKKGELPSSSKG